MKSEYISDSAGSIHFQIFKNNVISHPQVLVILCSKFSSAVRFRH